MADEEKTEEEINIDFEEIGAFFKKHKTVIVYILLAVLLLMTFYSRTQNIPHLQNELNQTAYLLSPDDPYVFARYAVDIANGNLSMNDTFRYYPMGTDISGENLGPSYVAGYALKFAWIFNPSATIYDVAAYYAPVLLVISIAAFFFLAREMLEDDLAALIASGLLAFSISIFFRTTAGFLEKEPLFLPLMVLGFLFFLRAYKQKELGKWTYINAAISGVFTGLSALSSGLFFFAEIYISTFFMIEVLLNKINKQKLITFTIWFALLSIMIVSLMSKYGNPLTYFLQMQADLPVIAIIFGIIAIYVKKPKQIEWMPNGVFHLLIGLGLVLLAGLAISAVSPNFLSNQINFVVDRISAPLGTNRFERSVSENQPPSFLGGGNSWWTTFGVSFLSFDGSSYLSIGLVFLMFFFGGIIMFYREFKNFKYAKYLTAIFMIFLCALIFENFSGGDTRYQWVNSLFSSQIFYFALFGITIVLFLFLEHRSREHLENINSSYLLVLTWFVISTIAANGAVRLFFMLAFPAMIMAAYFIKWAAESLAHRVNSRLWSLPYLFGALILLLSFSVITISNASMYPGLQSYYDALHWVSNNTPTDAVFTHWWDYGYIVQTIGQRATVVDPGNFLVQRDYDTGGYLFNAFNNSESLTYLNNYGKPSYWFIISEDIPKFFQISNLGSLSNLTGALKNDTDTLGREAYFSTYAIMNQETSFKPNSLGVYSDYPVIALMDPLSGPSQVLADFKVGNVVYDGYKTFILRLIVPLKNNSQGPLLAQVFNSVTQRMELFKVQCICQQGIGCSDVNNTDNASLVPTCILQLSGGVVNIPYKTKDVLFTQLYVLQKKVPGYDLVYSSSAPLDLLAMAGRATNIQIYKFNYTELEQNKGW